MRPRVAGLRLGAALLPGRARFGGGASLRAAPFAAPPWRRLPRPGGPEIYANAGEGKGRGVSPPRNVSPGWSAAEPGATWCLRR